MCYYLLQHDKREYFKHSGFYSLSIQQHFIKRMNNVRLPCIFGLQLYAPLGKYFDDIKPRSTSEINSQQLQNQIDLVAQPTHKIVGTNTRNGPTRSAITPFTGPLQVSALPEIEKKLMIHLEPEERVVDYSFVSSNGRTYSGKNVKVMFNKCISGHEVEVDILTRLAIRALTTPECEPYPWVYQHVIHDKDVIIIERPAKNRKKPKIKQNRQTKKCQQHNVDKLIVKFC